MTGHVLATLLILAANPDQERITQACETSFQVLVGQSQEEGFGVSLAALVRNMNSAINRAGLSTGNSEWMAKDIPALVKALKTGKSKYMDGCRKAFRRATDPCRDYTEEKLFMDCANEHSAPLLCFFQRGPWNVLLALPTGTLTADQETFAKLARATYSHSAECKAADTKN